MFEGTSILDFVEEFKTDEDYKKYLYELKWQKGFICKKNVVTLVGARQKTLISVNVINASTKNPPLPVLCFTNVNFQ